MDRSLGIPTAGKGLAENTIASIGMTFETHLSRGRGLAQVASAEVFMREKPAASRRISAPYAVFKFRYRESNRRTHRISSSRAGETAPTFDAGRSGPAALGAGHEHTAGLRDRAMLEVLYATGCGFDSLVGLTASTPRWIRSVHGKGKQGAHRAHWRIRAEAVLAYLQARRIRSRQIMCFLIAMATSCRGWGFGKF
jgi:site-specific recombinase XerD